jgi:hypothetical protein
MNLQEFWASITTLINSLFGRYNHLPDVPTGGNSEQVQRKVLVISFNPTIPSEGGQKLMDLMKWNNPNNLISGYIGDIRTSSSEYASYSVTEQLEEDQFPTKEDKFVYNPDNYLVNIRSGTGFHEPDTADYHEIIKKFDIVNKVNSGAIDEVWLFGFPYAGFYESRMAGPNAFWCNAPPILDLPNCLRSFVIMGFSYERGIGEMLESFSHRVEFTLRQQFRNLMPSDNLWQRFTRYDKANPGKAEVGSVHYAPNSQTDYDWGNRSYTPSFCNNWFHFPDLSGAAVNVNCNEWGNGDIRMHHNWWLRHLPHIIGRKNGISYNWWEYVLYPEKVS